MNGTLVDFEASWFIAVPGASSYTQTEASRSQGLEYGIDSHIRGLNFSAGAGDRGPDNPNPGNRSYSKRRLKKHW